MNSTQIRGAEAKQLLGNPLFKGAIEAIRSSIESQEISCPPDDRDKCVRLIITKQLLVGIEREIKRYIEDGEVEEIKEAKKRSVVKKVFTR